MTHITIQEDIHLQKTTFASIWELYGYCIAHGLLERDSYTEFWILPEDQISEDIRSACDEVTKLPEESFTDLN